MDQHLSSSGDRIIDELLSSKKYEEMSRRTKAERTGERGGSDSAPRCLRRPAQCIESDLENAA